MNSESLGLVHLDHNNVVILNMLLLFLDFLVESYEKIVRTRTVSVQLTVAV